MQIKSTVATVLIPTHKHSQSLLRAVNSVLTQTIKEIEILIIGDGVPDTTRDVVTEIQKRDKRVQFFDFPKGDRRGELYRHALLSEASGEIICYLADDNLYLPNHIEIMHLLLQNANFANALPILVNRDGTVSGWPVNLSLATDREHILSIDNLIPLSCGAHTLELYRQLPYGWRITPENIYTDLYMWRQFLADPHCIPVSNMHPTVLTFPSAFRKDLTMEQICQELDQWSEKLADQIWKEDFVQKVSNVVQQMSFHRTSTVLSP